MVPPGAGLWSGPVGPADARGGPPAAMTVGPPVGGGGAACRSAETHFEGEESQPAAGPLLPGVTASVGEDRQDLGRAQGQCLRVRQSRI